MDAALLVHVIEGLSNHEEGVLSELIADLLSALVLPVNVILEGACFHELANDEVHVFMEESLDVFHHMFAIDAFEAKELVNEPPGILDLFRFWDRFHAELHLVFHAAADVRVVVDLLRNLVVLRRVLFLDFEGLEELLNLMTVHHGAIGASNSNSDCLSESV